MQNFVMGEFHELQALAKINLRLKVVGRLENGHHLLQMVNVLTSLSDSIKIAIKKTPSINIQVSGYEENGLPSSSSDNIIYKTIHSFFSAISLDYGADVLLEKNIPSKICLLGVYAENVLRENEEQGFILPKDMTITDIRNMVQKIYGYLPAIELFSETPSEDWDVWMPD